MIGFQGLHWVLSEVYHGAFW